MPTTHPPHLELPPVKPRMILRAVARWWLAFLGVFVFGAIAAQLHRDSGVGFDGPILAWLHDMRSPHVTAFMGAVTHLGDGIVLAGIAAAAALGLSLRGHPYSALFVAGSAFGAGALNHVMKVGFARPRPELLLQLSPTDGFAFPSGHSTGAAALYGALAIVVITRFPKVRVLVVSLCVFLVGLIGLSRAYLHVHFPSDVVAGWGVGLLWPLLLKPLVLGRGFRQKAIAGVELEADGVRAGR
jgi:membrane-associated phospholipid phosphatase